jgi:hypothetical protein
MSEGPSNPAESVELKPNLMPVFIVVFALLLIGGILSFVFIGGMPPTHQQTSGSYSLVGHHAYRTLLQRLGYTVMINRTNLTAYPDMPPLLYLAPEENMAERFLHYPLHEEINKILALSGTVCVVCPKWDVTPDFQNLGWISEKKLISADLVKQILSNLGLSLKIRRLERSSVTIEMKDKPERLVLAGEHIQVFPSHDELRSNEIVLATTQEGSLLAIEYTIGSGRLILVSDPDLFTNYGLAQGDNGVVAANLTEYLAPKRKMILDEVAHGFGKDLNILKIILSYPIVLITLQILVAAIAILLPLGHPFNPILPEPTQERSREEQLKSIAQITYAGGHHNHFLQKYFKSVIKQMQEHYPVLSSLNFEQQMDYLDSIAKEKGIPYSVKQIYEKVKIAQTMPDIEKALAKIYRYQQRMLQHHPQTSWAS